MDETTTYILDTIPFEPDMPVLMKRLHIKDGSANATEFLQMIDDARALAHPWALYQVAYITERGEDWVEIGGQYFSSRVLRVNLENAHRVFPYLATCGPELQSWGNGYEDVLPRFWAESIKEAALFCAIQALFEDLRARFGSGKTASMSPGSLTDWPIQEQVKLFDLFGPAANAIGVCLTDSMLMVPTKSVSGIQFPTEVDFESCQLCPRVNCPGRRAPYDADLYEARYSHKV